MNHVQWDVVFTLERATRERCHRFVGELESSQRSRKADV